MSEQSHVIVVGGGPGLCDRILQMGGCFTLVERPGHVDHNLVALAQRTIITSFDDNALIPALKAMHQNSRFTAALSLTETGLLLAAQINQALELPGVTPEVVARTRDKIRMREWLNSAGFSRVTAKAVQSVEQIRDFAEEYGYPVIVKPRDGQGSQHIFCFSHPEDVRLPAGQDNSDYLAEPFLDGPEFSVEAFSQRGQHHIVAITGKFTHDQDKNNPFVEVGHVVPANLTQQQQQTIVEYISRFLSVMAITEGCSHTEIRLTSTGPEVIETHTRVGGDSIPTLVRQATGYDLLDNLVASTLNQNVSLQVSPSPARAAAIRFFTPPPGRVTAVHGAERWQGLPGVMRLHLPLRRGDIITAIKDSFSRVGYVLTVAEDNHSAVLLCEQVMRGIRIDVEQSAS